MKTGMGSHESSFGKTDEWLTPMEILKPLGEFDLDPCAPVVRPWEIAKVHYTIHDNGLQKPWYDWRVWLNPPYSRDIIGQWMKKMGEHSNGIALIFARTETAFFQQYVFPMCDSILFLEGRITFCNTAGIRAKMNAGAPSVLIAYGFKNVETLGDSGLRGKHLLVNATPIVIVGVSPTWKSVVTIAMSRLGQADLNVIYEVVEQIAPDKVAANEHYKEKIRQQLQYHFTRIKKGHYGNTICTS